MMRLHLDWALSLSIAVAVVGACSDTENASEGTGAIGGAGGGDASLGGSAGAVGDAGSDVLQPDETVVVVGPGADASSQGKFGGADDPYSKPEIVYPTTGIVMPPNTQTLEVHWKPAPGQTLFEIRFESKAIALVVYTGCTSVGGGCVYQTDKSFWAKLVDPNRGGPPVSYRIRGVNGGSPSTVGTSETRTLAFSKEDIIGGLYYWNTSGVIQRFDFGLPGAPAEQYMTPAMAGALTCVGCRALARRQAHGGGQRHPGACSLQGLRRRDAPSAHRGSRSHRRCRQLLRLLAEG